MPGADQHAAVLRDEREDVARRHDMLRPLGRIDRHRDGARAVGGRNAGGDPVLRLDRGGEGGFVPGAVVPAHQLQAKLLHAGLGKRQADEPAAVLRHEVDRIRRRHLRGDDEVALVLPVLVIDQDEHPAVARRVDQLFGAGEEAAFHQRLSSIMRPR